MTTKHTPATPLPQLGIDWKDASVSFYTMDGVILARSFDSTKGKLYEEIVRRSNAYPRLASALHNLFCSLCTPETKKTALQEQRMTEARALLRSLVESE